VAGRPVLLNLEAVSGDRIEFGLRKSVMSIACAVPTLHPKPTRRECRHWRSNRE
jgi:hypothetical protein